LGAPKIIVAAKISAVMGAGPWACIVGNADHRGSERCGEVKAAVDPVLRRWGRAHAGGYSQPS